MLENGLETCSCKWRKCARHGDCAACMEHHKAHKKHKLPFCKRQQEKELEKQKKKQDKSAI